MLLNRRRWVMEGVGWRRCAPNATWTKINKCWNSSLAFLYVSVELLLRADWTHPWLVGFDARLKHPVVWIRICENNEYSKHSLRVYSKAASEICSVLWYSTLLPRFCATRRSGVVPPFDNQAMNWLASWKVDKFTKLPPIFIMKEVLDLRIDLCLQVER